MAGALIDGRGDDFLSGGVGADTHAFLRNDGFDTIRGCKNGVDLFQISNSAGAFGALIIGRGDALGAVVRFGAIMIVLTDHEGVDLSAADVLF
ncbi:MAG: hypothetical protein AAF360_16200 [Pseudomonadota bacterium]